ncbi:unnamed protein product [Protopolystoma xenopodis]|uniref:GSKIP domain-containing protein n=1 Tax=Protopolystoma xenopodis TaxID=117903 RepID=A0A448WFB0_9PLAT|nr:unnamed protein product [Protopolystoma xenopodis]
MTHNSKWESEMSNFGEKEFSVCCELKFCTSEAEAAVLETSFGVEDIRIADALPFSPKLAYINLTTLEGDRFCVEITCLGFRPVGRV